MTMFRDLAIGDTFDWIGPNSRYNSFFERCVKTGTRTYELVNGKDGPRTFRVGSKDANVFHIGKDWRVKEIDGTSGQDRDSYSDTQDRDSYDV